MTLKIGVFIGRFQPFHLGHFDTLVKALDKYDQVVVVLGSHNTLRSYKNPWTSVERETVIRRSLLANYNYRLRFHWQEDRDTNEQWVSEVIQGVNQHIIDFQNDHKVFLTGYKKDDSSYYLDLFPEWELDTTFPNFDINATDIRKGYFEGNMEVLEKVPYSSYKMLSIFKATNLYKELVQTKDQ